MAITNQERIGKALELLKDGLRPFVERDNTGIADRVSDGREILIRPPGLDGCDHHGLPLQLCASGRTDFPRFCGVVVKQDCIRRSSFNESHSKFRTRSEGY